MNLLNRKKKYRFVSECCHYSIYREKEWSICKKCFKKCFLIKVSKEN